MESNQERNSTYEVRYRAKVAEGAVGEHRQQHTQQKNTSQFLLDGGNASGRRDNETLPLCFCP